VAGGAALADERAEFGDGLDGADFVVGEMDGDEHGLRPERAAHVLDADEAVVVDGQARHLPVAPLQRVADAAHGGVLDVRGDEVAAAVGVGLADAADGEVVGLGAAREKDQFVRPRVNQGRDLAPRAVDGRPRLLPEEVDARRVAEPFGQVRQHRLDDPPVDRRRRAVIHVNSAEGHRGLAIFDFRFLI
jgi:hypothetical protein